MHSMGQIDPNDATHVDCLKRFVNFLTVFLVAKLNSENSVAKLISENKK